MMSAVFGKPSPPPPAPLPPTPEDPVVARSMAAEAVPIAAGELTIGASASMVFAIE